MKQMDDDMKIITGMSLRSENIEIFGMALKEKIQVVSR